MKHRTLAAQAAAYLTFLEQEERSPATRHQYQRELFRLIAFLGEAPLEKQLVLQYKQALEQAYQPTSVNAKLAALNGFFSFIGRADLHLKQLRIQRKAFCSEDRELTKAEYLRLVRAAESQKNERLSLLLQTICATGIRVSELHYITVEAVRTGEAAIRLKGKNRVILLPGRLRTALKRYFRKESIRSGPVFVTKSGRPLDRSNIWKMMKALCAGAGVDAKKVFPHNLRHLFARTFYALDKDLAKLADILGHSNINTTRIYIITTAQEHRRQMDVLGLVV